MIESLAGLMLVSTVLGLGAARSDRWIAAGALCLGGIAGWQAAQHTSLPLAVAAAALAVVAWLCAGMSRPGAPHPIWAAAACGLIVAVMSLLGPLRPGMYSMPLALLLVGVLWMALGRTVHGAMVAGFGALLALVTAGQEPAVMAVSVAGAALLAWLRWPTALPVPRWTLAYAGASGAVLAVAAPTSWLAWLGLAVATASNLSHGRARRAVAPCAAGLALLLFGLAVPQPTIAQPVLLAGLATHAAVLLVCLNGGVASVCAVLTMSAALWTAHAHGAGHMAGPIPLALGLAAAAGAAWAIRPARPHRTLALAAIGHGGLALACFAVGPGGESAGALHLASHAMVQSAALLLQRPAVGFALAGLPPAGLFFSEALFLRAAAQTGWIVLPAAAVLTWFATALLRCSLPAARRPMRAFGWASLAASSAAGMAVWLR